jgi:two-component system OmpR family response regulator
MPPLAAHETLGLSPNPVTHGLVPGPAGMLISRPAPRNLTLLLVEDSRVACDALRLICGRLGLRMRRAETIEAARSHLRTYLPDIVLIDLGLPDGRGEELIRQIILSTLRPALVLGTSGSDDGRQRCLAAGADGFLPKPVESITSLAQLILKLCPDLSFGLRPLVARDGGTDRGIIPDPLAFKDDLNHAAALLADQDGLTRYASYIGPFLAGVAGCAHDEQLAAAVRNVTDAAPESRKGETVRRLEKLIRGRIDAAGTTAGI